MKSIEKETKKTFRKFGACSATYFHILDKEFGNTKEDWEKAADPLAGGIMQQGYQCGMIWGASMAAGRQAFKIENDRSKAIELSVGAAKELLSSFHKKHGTVDCSDITQTDFSSKFQFVKFIIFKARSCFSHAGKWAGEAINTAKESLSNNKTYSNSESLSCASEVLKIMGASEEEQMTVAGFAGGLGLSGNACGALSAAIWYNTKKFLEDNPDEKTYPNPAATKTIEAFYKASDFEMMCSNICNKKFKSVQEHSEYIKSGGCEKIIQSLSI